MRKGSYSEELVRMCRDEHEGDLQRVESRISPDTNVYTGVQMMAVCAAARWRRSNHAGVVLPRVEANDGVEGTKLEATVRDDFSEGHAETSVQGKEALEANSRFIKTNEQTVEGFVPSQHPKEGAFERSPEDTRS